MNNKLKLKPEPPVILIGFMGAGKTTIGEIASNLLGFDFIDVDREIEKEYGMSVSEIFSIKGEESFRIMESAVLRRACRQPASVIACGGGVVLAKNNRRLLDKNPYVIWLKTPVVTCLKRCCNSSRPLLSGISISSVRKLFAEREPFYRRLAKLEIETAGNNPGLIAENIALKIEALMASGCSN